MGDLIPLADYARGDRVLGAADSPWLRPAPDPGDWDPCTGCLIRSACREVRECHQPDDVPDVPLRLVEPPDIVA